MANDELDPATLEAVQGCTLPCTGMESRRWFAWDNVQPPMPNSFHATSEVYVPNPGVEVHLVPRSPQGINPAILLIDVILIQKPGVWPRVLTWKTGRYDLVYGEGDSGYSSVNVFCGDEVVADVHVLTVH